MAAIPYKDSEIPPELIPYAPLLFATASKYAMFLFGDEGSPLWTAYRTQHRDNVFITQLSNTPIWTNFRVPEHARLSALFDDPAKLGLKPKQYDTADPRTELLKNMAADFYFTFQSKNLFERRFVPFPFRISTPLSYMNLFRLSENRFLGLLVYAGFFSELAGLDTQPAVLTDLNERIIAINESLVRTLALPAPDDYLGKPFSDLLRIERPEQPLPSVSPLLKTVLHWEPGIPFPFKPMGAKASGSARETDAFSWTNETYDYAYLGLEPLFDTDGRDFEITFDYLGEWGAPNVVVRGKNNPLSGFTDEAGYTFAVQTSKSMVQVKRAGDPICYFDLPLLNEPGRHCLTFGRSGSRYYVTLDSQYHETSEELEPLFQETDHRLLLFLRPGERARLFSLEIRLGTVMAEAQTRKTTIGRAHGKKGEFVFQVRSKQRAFHEMNVMIHLLEDITAIAHEKERLSGLAAEQNTWPGISEAAQTLRQALIRIAPSELTLLIEGETGTGKGLLAAAVHANSPRRNGPFVKVDCSAIPETLLESELFGHEKGAFTGAAARHTGRFEQAQGGTLFLDEIENIPLLLQAKLLSALEDRVITRLGGKERIALDVRVISAINQPVRDLLEKGLLRQDLYYRLNQYRFVIPPLRERPEDIMFYAERFLSQANIDCARHIKGFHEKARGLMLRHAWPGNVRELRNLVLRAVLMAAGEVIMPQDLDLANESTQKGAAKKRGGPRKKRRIDKAEFVKALEKSGGNVSESARLLNISRSLMYKLIRKREVRPELFREA